MARNNGFYKKSFLGRIKDFIKNCLSWFALLVLLYYYTAGNLTNAILLYLSFPFALLKDFFYKIISGT